MTGPTWPFSKEEDFAFSSVLFLFLLIVLVLEDAVRISGAGGERAFGEIAPPACGAEEDYEDEDEDDWVRV